MVQQNAGKFFFGETFEVNPGDSWNILGGIIHSTKALEDSVAIEIFFSRKRWISAIITGSFFIIEICVKQLMLLQKGNLGKAHHLDLEFYNLFMKKEPILRPIQCIWRAGILKCKKSIIYASKLI